MPFSTGFCSEYVPDLELYRKELKTKDLYVFQFCLSLVSFHLIALAAYR